MHPFADVLRPLILLTRSAFRLWVAHWPALLVFALLAQAGHAFFLSSAVVATRIHAVVGLVFLPLAPLSVLVGYIIMLRVCARDNEFSMPLSRPSWHGNLVQGDSEQNLTAQQLNASVHGLAKETTPLSQALDPIYSPNAATHTDDTSHNFPLSSSENEDSSRLSLSGLIAAVSASLLSFITLYTAQGTWRVDLQRFFNEIYADHIAIGELLEPQKLSSRYGLDSPSIMLGLVATALALRWGIRHFKVEKRYPRVILLSGYLEAFWVISLAGILTSRIQSIREWFFERAIIVWFIDLFPSPHMWLDHLAGPNDWGNIAEIWSSLRDIALGVVIVPLATLVLAAAVYGASYKESEWSQRLSQHLSSRLSRHSRLDLLTQKIGGAAQESISTIRATISAFQRLFTIGIGPVSAMMFLVAMVSLLRTPLAYLTRAVVGAQAESVWFALKPILHVLTEATFLSLSVPVVAACSMIIAQIGESATQHSDGTEL